MTGREEPPAVLVVSDDAVLGELIASNLRLRGLAAARVALAAALREGWRPAAGAPRLLIVSIEAPERTAPADLERLLDRPWAVGVPCALAVERTSRLARQAAAFLAGPMVPPSDIGAIVAAARQVLARPLPARAPW